MNDAQGADWTRQAIEALEGEGLMDLPQREFGEVFKYGSYLRAWRIDAALAALVPGLEEGDMGRWLVLAEERGGISAASVETEEGLDGAELDFSEWLLEQADGEMGDLKGEYI